MKLCFKLAASGIRNNHRIYIPYILSCVGVIMMTYILHALSLSEVIKGIRGSGNIMFVLSLGKFVITVFALLFLFYTNSFLIRKRNREFGLYNVLGMGKVAIGRIAACEALITGAVSIVLGLFLGIVFSKFAELGLLNITKQSIDFGFSVNPSAVFQTALVYLIIFVLLYINTMVILGRTKVTQLLKSESLGEKPPRANFVLALLGIAVLGVAYAMALSIDQPLKALELFFVAVILVILGTYMLFTAGSVAICRILQKDKKYYYKKNHFTSVSSMVFRMKRNGVGLASICILATMVLVMISSTTSLYIGEENALDARYPKDNSIGVYKQFYDYSVSDKVIDGIRSDFEDCFKSRGVEPKNLTELTFMNIAGTVNGSVLEPDVNRVVNQFGADLNNLRQVFIMSAEDYNRNMGTSIKPAPGSVYIACLRCDYSESEFSIGDAARFSVAGKLDKAPNLSEFTTANAVAPAIIVVTESFDEFAAVRDLKDVHENRMTDVKWIYAYDIDGSDEVAEDIMQEQVTMMRKRLDESMNGFGYSTYCRADESIDFNSTFGGLFFLGIVLSIIFIFGTVLIIYYKQISEGYEDRSRFDIMQKVGMTAEDIKKSINSQVMTVFFAPLLMAGLHLGFAFPFLWRILQLFGLENMKLIIIVTIAAFAAFGALYAVIYKLTARTYYHIVSGIKA